MFDPCQPSREAFLILGWFKKIQDLLSLSLYLSLSASVLLFLSLSANFIFKINTFFKKELKDMNQENAQEESKMSKCHFCKD